MNDFTARAGTINEGFVYTCVQPDTTCHTFLNETVGVEGSGVVECWNRSEARHYCPHTVRFCETRIHLQQIQGGQQISFFIHLLAFSNLLEINHRGGVQSALDPHKWLRATIPGLLVNTPRALDFTPQ